MSDTPQDRADQRDLEALARRVGGRIPPQRVEALTGVEIDEFTTAEQIQEAAEAELDKRFHPMQEVGQSWETNEPILEAISEPDQTNPTINKNAIEERGTRVCFVIEVSVPFAQAKAFATALTGNDNDIVLAAEHAMRDHIEGDMLDSEGIELAVIEEGIVKPFLAELAELHWRS